MCGRTCMTLAPEDVICACKYSVNGDNKLVVKPTYRKEFNLNREYKPAYNLTPTSILPIIVSAKHFNSESNSAERVIIPALWSIIPRWHHGDYKKHGLTTNNARMEGIQNSKMYKPLLNAGKRCVMVVEGFYEWQTVNEKLKSNERPVYFVYMPQQDESIKIEDKSTWSCEKLLHIAGLFDIWHDDKGDSIYSFTIVTFESNQHFNWLHHRTPAILETEDQIRDWLDFERVPQAKALELIIPPKSIVWHEVSHYVNSNRNQSEACNKPIKSENKAKGSLLSWVKRGGDEDEKSPKRLKKE